MNLAESPWKDLIKVYAENPVQTITTLQTYKDLCAKYEKKSAFAAARGLIEDIAIKVESRMSKALGSTDESSAALELLKRYRARPDEMKICHALLEQGYVLKWSPGQLAYFQEGYRQLSQPYDFFFSFSNRSEGVASENPINNEYKHFILTVLTDKDWQSADRSKENLLAKAVYTHMAEKKGHKGFYFPDSQYDNTFTVAKLDTLLSQSHVFVQLIQNIMLRVPPNKIENYCHFEFVRAHERLSAEGQIEHRMLFLVAESRKDFAEIEDVYPGYDLWFETIKRKDVPYISEVSIQLDARQIKTLVEDRLVDLIDAAWDRLIDNVPQ